MTDTFKQQIGKLSEQQARDFLQARGFTLVQANFRCQLGEIDLVMKDKMDIVFVEVRTRSSADYGCALGSVNKSKQQKIIRAATYYLQQKKLFNKVGCRFDVIAIDNSSSDTPIQWVKSAFSVDRF